MTAEELGQMIWNVKELLRNVYDNKDVEDVILPFTLLRRLDCVLVGSESRVAANMKQLEELGQTSQEDIAQARIFTFTGEVFQNFTDVRTEAFKIGLEVICQVGGNCYQLRE